VEESVLQSRSFRISLRANKSLLGNSSPGSSTISDMLLIRRSHPLQKKSKRKKKRRRKPLNYRKLK